MRRLVSLLVATAVVLAAVGASSAATGRSITIVKASAAPSGIVTVQVKIRGWKMYPALVGKKPNKLDGGHWHVLVDGKYSNASAKATSGKSLALESGTHRITVELANNDHSLLKPRVRSGAVTVVVDVPTVPADPLPSPPSEPPPGY